MAFDHPLGPDISVEASGDLSANQFLLHDVDASGQLVLSSAAGTGYVLQDKPSAQGQAGNIRISNVTKVELGATVAAGAQVESDAAGKAVTLAAGIAVGHLLTGGDAGEVVAMIVIPN